MKSEKKTDIWMPIYIGDYLKDTMHLSTEEHGAYLLLLMEMWSKDGWIPVDDKKLSRIVRAPLDVWKNSIKPSLIDFFREDEGGLTQDRLLKELEESKKRRVIAKENGAKGGRPPKPTENPQVISGLTQTITKTEPNQNLNYNPEESSSSSSSSSHSKSNTVRGGFIKPTIPQVADFCKERQNSIDPEKFWHHYEARGWELSNGKKVKDWRSCVITWEKSAYQAQGGTNSTPTATTTTPPNKTTKFWKLEEKQILARCTEAEAKAYGHIIFWREGQPKNEEYAKIYENMQLREWEDSGKKEVYEQNIKIFEAQNTENNTKSPK